MSGHAIAVLETTPRWVPELKRRFLGCSVSVRGFSSVRDFGNAVDAGIPVVVLGLDDLEDVCLDWLGRIGRHPAPPRIVVVGSTKNASLEWPIRELGATAFVRTDCPSDEMFDLCRRLLKNV